MFAFFKALGDLTSLSGLLKEAIAALVKLFRLNKVKQEIKKTEEDDRRAKEIVASGDVDRSNKELGTNPDENNSI